MLWKACKEACLLGQSILKMIIKLPEDVNYIISRLEAAGYEGYAVGGCVRDSLLGREPKDWDITTSADPTVVKSLFRRTIDTGIEHGTVTVMLQENGYEVTTYRIDGKYSDGRHPEKVTFTPNLKEDLLRRDFTINAMAYNDKQGLVDMYGGVEDLEKKIIRAVGDPVARFSEDALRMMRAIRFGAELGFEIEDATYQAIKKLAPTLEKISAERIFTELMKTILSNNPMDFGKYYDTGLTSVFMPEFDEAMKCEQHNPHHCYSVGEHTLHVMNEVEATPVLRLAALLHDIAKPRCLMTDEQGVDHFHKHPYVGSKMAEDILRRLKSDNDTIKTVRDLVRWHDLRPEDTEKSVRKAVSKVGVNLIDNLVKLKYADVYGQSTYKREEKLNQIEYLKKHYKNIVEAGQCLTIKELKINGQDLMTLGVKAGPKMGELLNNCLELVLEDPSENTKEKLIKYVNSKL